MAHGRETPEPPGVGGHHGGDTRGAFRGCPRSHVASGSIPRVSLAGVPPREPDCTHPSTATAPAGISTPGTSLPRQVRDLSAHVRCPWIPHGGGSAADYRCGDAGLLLPEVDLSVRQRPGSLPVLITAGRSLGAGAESRRALGIPASLGVSRPGSPCAPRRPFSISLSCPLKRE